MHYSGDIGEKYGKGNHNPVGGKIVPSLLRKQCVYSLADLWFADKSSNDSKWHALVIHYWPTTWIMDFDESLHYEN